MGDIVEDFKKEFYGDFRYEGTPRGVMAWLPGAVKKNEIQAQIDVLDKAEKFLMERIDNDCHEMDWISIYFQEQIDRLKAIKETKHG